METTFQDSTLTENVEDIFQFFCEKNKVGQKKKQDRFQLGSMRVQGRGCNISSLLSRNFVEVVVSYSIFMISNPF